MYSLLCKFKKENSFCPSINYQENQKSKKSRKQNNNAYVIKDTDTKLPMRSVLKK